MIGYCTIGVSDRGRALAFYDELLGELGARQLMGMDRIKMYGTGPDAPMLALCIPYNEEPHHPGNGNMVAISGARVRASTGCTPRRWNSAPAMRAHPANGCRDFTAVTCVTSTATNCVSSKWAPADGTARRISGSPGEGARPAVAARFPGYPLCRMSLTREQVESYREQGYLLLPGLVAEKRLACYEQRFLEFARGTLELPPGMKLMRDVMIVRGATKPERAEDAVNKAFRFHDDPGMFAYCLEPGIVSAVRSLIGEDVYSITTNLFNKPPGVDGRHPLHQDLLYFNLRPPEHRRRLDGADRHHSRKRLPGGSARQPQGQAAQA